MDKEKTCGGCRFFVDESTGGEGNCVVRKRPMAVRCDKKACIWYKEKEKDA